MWTYIVFVVACRLWKVICLPWIQVLKDSGECVLKALCFYLNEKAWKSYKGVFCKLQYTQWTTTQLILCYLEQESCFLSYNISQYIFYILERFDLKGTFYNIKMNHYINIFFWNFCTGISYWYISLATCCSQGLTVRTRITQHQVYLHVVPVWFGQCWQYKHSCCNYSWND